MGLINGPTDDPNHTLARMSKAQVLAKSTAPVHRKAALKELDSVIRDLSESDPQTADKARQVKADTLYANARGTGGAERKKLFEEASEAYAFLINEREDFRTAPNYANLGKSYEEIENWDGALGAYTSFFILPLNRVVEYAVPARLSSVKIQIEHKGDQERAYKMLFDMLQGYHKYLNSAEYPKTRDSLKEAVPLYKKLQMDLNKEPDLEEEARWGI